MRRVIRLLDKAVDITAAVACFVLFCICLYASFDAFNVYYGSLDKGVLKYKPQLGEDAEALRELSDDAVAWLTVDNTNIDYPIMQGKTNTDYLNKNCYGEYSLSGSIFLDSRNRGDFADPYSLVYGHHMEYGAMFGSLDQYADGDYLKSHRKGTLVTTKGQGNRITLFASCKALATEQVVFDPPESDNALLMEYLKTNAAVFQPQDLKKGDRIIALSTCQGADSIERMIVFGVLRQDSAVTGDATGENET